MDVRWLNDHALRYIGRFESSAAAVALILERRIRERCARTDEDVDPALARIPDVTNELVRLGYIDDRRYASTAFEQMREKGRSAAEIRSKLERKGIDESILSELFRGEGPKSDIRAAWRLAERRRLGPYCEDPDRRLRDRNRHLGVFARHGFDRTTAEEIVDAQARPELR